MQAKQSPAGKAQRAIATDGKTYFSYAQIHATVSAKVDEVRAFKPDVIVAIGGGGFIPARMLRTEVRVPIVAISLELYDDNTRSANTTVIKKQWFDENSGAGRLVRGHRVLIVDEVDDTRATLQYAVEELIRSNGPAAVATFVVHDKLKPKKGVMPPNVQIIVGEEVPDNWNCYPWDAAAYGRDIYAHEELARWCGGETDTKPCGEGGGWAAATFAVGALAGAAVAMAIARSGLAS